jgi:hypothetical protein
METNLITVNAYSSSDISFTGHVTVTITVEGISKTYERTLQKGIVLGLDGLTTAGIVQETPARRGLNGLIEHPSASTSITVSKSAAVAARLEMERLAKTDVIYGVAFNNCADLVRPEQSPCH